MGPSYFGGAAGVPSAACTCVHSSGCCREGRCRLRVRVTCDVCMCVGGVGAQLLERVILEDLEAEDVDDTDDAQRVRCLLRSTDRGRGQEARRHARRAKCLALLARGAKCLALLARRAKCLALLARRAKCLALLVPIASIRLGPDGAHTPARRRLRAAAWGRPGSGGARRRRPRRHLSQGSSLPPSLAPSLPPPSLARWSQVPTDELVKPPCPFGAPSRSGG